jgi:hypothetical protein
MRAEGSGMNFAGGNIGHNDHYSRVMSCDRVSFREHMCDMYDLRIKLSARNMRRGE